MDLTNSRVSTSSYKNNNVSYEQFNVLLAILPETLTTDSENKLVQM